MQCLSVMLFLMMQWCLSVRLKKKRTKAVWNQSSIATPEGLGSESSDFQTAKNESLLEIPTLESEAPPLPPPPLPPVWKGLVAYAPWKTEPLGRGAYGEVWLMSVPCAEKSDEMVAMKVMKPKAGKASTQLLMANELEFMKDVAGVSEYVVSIVGAPETIQYLDNIYFLMPVYNRGEFHDVLVQALTERSLREKQGVLTVDVPEPLDTTMGLVAIFFQIAAGVSAIHAQGLTHMDIKPENTMIHCGTHDDSSVCHAIVIDLGLACKPPAEDIVFLSKASANSGELARFEQQHSDFIQNSSSTGRQFFDAQGNKLSVSDIDEISENLFPVKIRWQHFDNSTCHRAGTRGFAAPEIHRGRDLGHPANDVWALGCIFHLIMHTAHPPWMTWSDDRPGKIGNGALNNEQELLTRMRKAGNADYSFDKAGIRLAPLIGKMLQGMFKYSVEERSTIQDILDKQEEVMKIAAKMSGLEPENPKYTAAMNMVRMRPSQFDSISMPPNCVNSNPNYKTDVEDRKAFRSDCIQGTVELAQRRTWNCEWCAPWRCNPCCKCRIFRNGNHEKIYFRKATCD